MEKKRSFHIYNFIFYESFFDAHETYIQMHFLIVSTRFIENVKYMIRKEFYIVSKIKLKSA